MQVINENLATEKLDQLPEILMRIFSICKTDPNFPLKDKMKSIEVDANFIENKIIRQNEILNETVQLRNNLSERLQKIRQNNFELKSKLLEDLGSEL